MTQYADESLQVCDWGYMFSNQLATVAYNFKIIGMLYHLNNVESMHRHILTVFVKLLHMISYHWYDYLSIQINKACQYHNF